MTEDDALVERIARAIREAPLRQGIGMNPREPDPDVPLQKSEHAAARAALSVVREADGWRDMADAPRDGTDVLLWVDGRPPVVAGWFHDEWANFDTGRGVPFPDNIEAWRPLPPPPGAA